MPFYPFRALRTKLFATVLFVALAASGCEKKALPRPTCQNITIKVHHSNLHGVDHNAVYLCVNNTITWVPGPNVTSFEVKFVGDDLPFGTTTTFVGTTQPVTSPPLPDPGELTVFKYKVKIVDNTGQSHLFDPHVVGGGGL